MADGEQRDVDADVLQPVQEEDDAQQEEQVVVAGHHVLGAQVRERHEQHAGALLDVPRVAPRHAVRREGSGRGELPHGGGDEQEQQQPGARVERVEPGRGRNSHAHLGFWWIFGTSRVAIRSAWRSTRALRRRARFSGEARRVMSRSRLNSAAPYNTQAWPPMRSACTSCVRSVERTLVIGFGVKRASEGQEPVPQLRALLPALLGREPVPLEPLVLAGFAERGGSPVLLRVLFHRRLPRGRPLRNSIGSALPEQPRGLQRPRVSRQGPSRGDRTLRRWTDAHASTPAAAALRAG